VALTGSTPGPRSCPPGDRLNDDTEPRQHGGKVFTSAKLSANQPAQWQTCLASPSKSSLIARAPRVMNGVLTNFLLLRRPSNEATISTVRSDRP
jgi:hypothetical protein